ncbi:MAG: MBL fold metallo-hydrolase [Acidimicrobiales bacterium]
MAATLDWLGCATFRLTLDDLVVYCDAYIDRVPSAPPTGLTTAQVERAEFVVVGHSHFDHLWGAERIAKQTGAAVIGSYESIRIMAEAGVPDRQLIPVAGGERVRLSERVTVRVFPSQHSCVWSHQKMPPADQVCIGDLGVTWQEQRARFKELMEFFSTMSREAKDHLKESWQGDRGDGGALVYLFETPEGSILFQDTSGHWTGILRDLRPDFAILAAAGRGNIDGEPIQGSLAEFLARQVELLRPRRVTLGHHDAWLPGFADAIDVGPIRSALERRADYAELVEMPYQSGYKIF